MPPRGVRQHLPKHGDVRIGSVPKTAYCGLHTEFLTEFGCSTRLIEKSAAITGYLGGTVMGTRERTEPGEAPIGGMRKHRPRFRVYL